jgi:hypothetical protein
MCIGLALVSADGVLDDRLDRREAGAAGDQQHRFAGVLAQKEAAHWAAQAQQVALPHAAEDVFGELATRYAADVQLQQAVVVRRIGERERPSLAIPEQDVDVLSREELQPLAAPPVCSSTIITSGVCTQSAAVRAPARVRIGIRLRVS